jgi:hypothetical protein
MGFITGEPIDEMVGSKREVGTLVMARTSWGSRSTVSLWRRTTIVTFGKPSAASRGNVVLFCGLGNHVNLRGLPGGAERIRTSDLRWCGHAPLDPALDERFLLFRAHSQGLEGLAGLDEHC